MSKPLNLQGGSFARTPVCAASRWVLMAPVCLTVLLGKVGMAPFSTMGLSVALPCLLLLAVIATAMGVFQLHPGRALAYALLIVFVGSLQLFSDHAFSVPSLVFLGVLYAPFVLQIRSLEADGRFGMQAFGTFALLMAALGVLQYAAQFVVGVEWAFPLEHFLPSNVLIHNYNYLIPLYYGSSIFKSNGVFFIEPSSYSQFIAVALLLELATRNRMWRVLVHALALMCTYSGTGLIVLAAGLATLVLARRRWDLILVGLMVALLAFMLSDVLQLNVFLNRSNELSTPGSSGFERFVAWLYLLSDQFWSYPDRVLAGAGTGAFASFGPVVRFETAEMSFSKAIVDFGIPGALLYFGFLGYSIRSGLIPANVKVGLATCILMNGAYSESVSGILLGLVIWPAMAAVEASPDRTIHAVRPLIPEPVA